MRIIARESLGDAIGAAGDKKISRCLLVRGLWMVYVEATLRAMIQQ